MYRALRRHKNAKKTTRKRDIRNMEKLNARMKLYEIGELANNDFISDSYYNRVS